MTNSRYRTELLPPPHGIDRVGGGSIEDYLRISDEFFGYFTDMAGLRPDDAVLDIGCGYGRMALPMLDYLRNTGHYEGFDVIADAIEWLERHIEPYYPRFNFVHADLFNKAYNPLGSLRDHEYRFPYADSSFDFVFATSVFTHMLSPGVERYVSEVKRILRPGGRCLITWFVRNPESLALVAEEQSTLQFVVDFGIYSSTSEEVPEAAVCYDEDYLMDLYRRNSLAVLGGIRPGAWCGREQFVSYQDIIVAERASGDPLPPPRLHRAPARGTRLERSLDPIGPERIRDNGAIAPRIVQSLTAELAAARRRTEELAREQGRLQVQLAIAEGAVSRRLRRWLRRLLKAGTGGR